MFFKKKNTTPPENVAKQSIKTMDRVVTGVILGGVIASIYGIKKLRHKDEESHDDTHEESQDHSPEPEEKQSILSRIFFGNK